jgi:hypothetical protein
VDSSKLLPLLEERTGPPAPLEALENRELIAQVWDSAALLVRKEVELARAELRADLRREGARSRPRDDLRRHI